MVLGMALALALAAAGGACGGGSKPAATPTAVATATPTATATPIPSPAGTFAVYEATTTGDLASAVTRSIRQVDLATGRLVSTFDFGTGDDRAIAAILTPNHGLVWATQSGLYLGSLDGGKWQRDYTPPNGWLISAAAISHSGRYVAVSAFPTNILTGQGEVAIVDIRADIVAGQDPIVMRFEHNDPRLRSVGDFANSQWLPNDTGVVVFGMTYNEGPAPSATLLLNGDMSVGQFPWLSRDGKLEVLPADRGCHGYSNGLSMADAVTGAVLFSIGQDGVAYGAQEFSPLEDALLYTTYDCNQEELDPHWWLAKLDGQNIPVADPDTIRREWYGPNIAELRCTGSDTVFIAPPADGRLQCPDPYHMGTLTIGGVNVGNAIAVHTLGIIAP